MRARSVGTPRSASNARIGAVLVAVALAGCGDAIGGQPEPVGSGPPGFSGSAGAPALVSQAPSGSGCEAGSGTDHLVGPGGQYAAINDVPWESLGPGDSVRIAYRPEPYHEKIVIAASGSAEAPIVVCGVAGPNGERPMLVGAGATLRAENPLEVPARAARGLVILTIAEGQEWGEKPRYVVIAGLDVSGAHSSQSYQAPDGTTTPHNDNAAGIWVERGEHITIRDNIVHGNGNGLFVSSGGEEESTSRDILVEGNHIYGNGNVDRYLEHNIYTEAEGIVFQYNRIDDLVEGAGGCALKDRSAGTVIRYNHIEGGARTLDLVETEWPFLAASPAYRDTYVYGNALVSRPGHAHTIVHYGGDSGVEDLYRKGTLHFFSNTVVHVADQEGPENVARWRSEVLQLASNGETAEVYDNILFATAATPGATPSDLAMNRDIGTTRVGRNLVSPGFREWGYPERADGTVEGWENLVEIPGNDPGFVDSAAGDFHLVAGSPAIDAAGPADAAPGYPVDRQYLPDLAGQERTTAGAAPDMGAFEYAG
jgi:parallel beta-helix repeat protein